MTANNSLPEEKAPGPTLWQMICALRDEALPRKRPTSYRVSIGEVSMLLDVWRTQQRKQISETNKDLYKAAGSILDVLSELTFTESPKDLNIKGQSQ
jgi:hypothetical protein